MEVNEGVVTGDLRVLVTRTGADLQEMSMWALLGALLVGVGWKVTVSPADSSEVLAEKAVGRRRTAERVRGEFIRMATDRGIDRTDPERIERLLRVGMTAGAHARRHGVIRE